MSTDFDNYLAYYKKNNPGKSVSASELKELYDRYYECDCITCNYRKEKGQIPYNTGMSNCRSPERPISL